MAEYRTTINAVSGGYTVSVYRGARKSAFHVTEAGAVSDKTSAVVISSDIAVLQTAFTKAGMSDMARKVQSWWNSH